MAVTHMLFHSRKIFNFYIPLRDASSHWYIDTVLLGDCESCFSSGEPLCESVNACIKVF